MVPKVKYFTCGLMHRLVYISSTKEWAIEKGIDWEPYWKDKDTKLYTLSEKITLYFTALFSLLSLRLMANLSFLRMCRPNEFLNLEGDKISTSRNWAVWLHE